MSGSPLCPNNVIPFDLIKSTVPIVNWGDSNNAKLLTQLLTSVLGLNTVPMTLAVLPGSTCSRRCRTRCTAGRSIASIRIPTA